MRGVTRAVAMLAFAVAPLWAQEEDEGGRSIRLEATGDLFVRLEAVRDAPNPLTRDFERARLRMRPGLEALLSEGRLVFGAGLLASMASDSNEDNEIRLDNFVSDDLAIDRAYVRVTAPEAPVSGTAGMFETPFSGTEVLWDRDLRFIGANAGWELPAGAMTAQRLLGAFSIGSQNHEDESVVAAARWEAEAGAGISLGAAMWAFGNTDALVEAGLARTNRLAPGGQDLLSDFQVVNLTVGWERLGARRPFRTRLDLLYNFGADDLRTGGDLRVDWGELQEAGTWRLRLVLQRIEQDATLAAFGGDEWWFRTRQRGGRLSFGFALARNAILEASWIHQRRDDLDEWLDRAFIDLAILL